MLINSSSDKKLILAYPSGSDLAPLTGNLGWWTDAEFTCTAKSKNICFVPLAFLSDGIYIQNIIIGSQSITEIPSTQEKSIIRFTGYYF